MIDKRTTGIYGKFDVTHIDGKSKPGEKHDGLRGDDRGDS